MHSTGFPVRSVSDLCLHSVGGLGAGAVTNVSSDGWRYIFWMQAAFHGATSLGLFLFYWPSKNLEYPKMTLKDYIWACDPIGSFLFISSATLLLLSLDWAGGAFAWADPHVAVPLALGLALMLVFAAYGESGPAFVSNVAALLTVSQSGRAVRMASLPTCSSAETPTLPWRPSHSLSKAGSSTPLLIPWFPRSS